MTLKLIVCAVVRCVRRGLYEKLFKQEGIKAVFNFRISYLLLVGLILAIEYLTQVT